MTDELRISYELRVPDLEELVLRNAAATLSPRFSAPYIAGALLRAAVVCLAVIAFADRSALLAACLAAGVAIAWLAWAPAYARRRLVQRSRERLSEPSSRFLLGPRTLGIGPDGFTVIGPQSEFRFDWTALQSVAQTPGRLFFYFTGFTAQVLPMPPADTAKVLDALRRYAPAALQTGA